MLDTDIRKRNNSSMTYNEYIDVYEVAPRKPIHRYKTFLIPNRPTEISMDDITDLSLDGSPSRQKSKYYRLLRPLDLPRRIINSLVPLIMILSH